MLLPRCNRSRMQVCVCMCGRGNAVLRCVVGAALSEPPAVYSNLSLPRAVQSARKRRRRRCLALLLSILFLSYLSLTRASTGDEREGRRRATSRPRGGEGERRRLSARERKKKRSVGLSPYQPALSFSLSVFLSRSCSTAISL